MSSQATASAPVTPSPSASSRASACAPGTAATGCWAWPPHERFGPREQLTLAQVGGCAGPPLHRPQRSPSRPPAEPLLVLPFDADWSTPVMPGRWPLAVEGEAQTARTRRPCATWRSLWTRSRARAACCWKTGLRGGCRPRAAMAQPRCRPVVATRHPPPHAAGRGLAFWVTSRLSGRRWAGEIQVHPGFAHHSRQGAMAGRPASARR